MFSPAKHSKNKVTPGMAALVFFSFARKSRIKSVSSVLK
jgi:hypothetical protein